MTQFRHLDGMVALLSEIYEINERVMTGDICSSKTAIASKRMKKLLDHYHEALSEDGATAISLDAYCAAGGWVGITYSYTIDGVEMQVPKGTLVIRAAEQLGIEVPRFCDHPLLDPVAACRADDVVEGRAGGEHSGW